MSSLLLAANFFKRSSGILKRITNNFFDNKYQNKFFVNFIKMSEMENKYRHVDTQTVESTFDVGNIFILKRNLFTDNTNSSTLVNSIENATESKEKTKEATSSSFKIPNVPPNIDKTRKRKASCVADIEIPKKIKSENQLSKAAKFTEEIYDETSYYYDNGLRKVYPYNFTFTTYSKGRWVGEKVLDIFAREFRAQTPEEFQQSIESGSIKVNNEKIETNYKFKHNDLLSNRIHRHEVPVTNKPIKIVYMDDDVLAINKPSSIPVHPCGRYRHNTVVFILAKDYNLKNLLTLHRLDRLTSGLLLFARTTEKARKLEKNIRERDVAKEYVCRVEGVFPDEIIDCHEPVEIVSFKIGVCRVTPKGKDCSTTFQKLSTNGKTSVVLCKPRTGRMHQIRVHLQYIGYPIINDPLYNHDVFGPLKGRGGDVGGKTHEQLIIDLTAIHTAENWLSIPKDEDGKSKIVEDTQSETFNKAATATNNMLDTNIISKNSITTQTGCDLPDPHLLQHKMSIDKNCKECKIIFRDPKPKDLVMYLHALKYKGPDWQFETEMPEWAADDWLEQ